MGALRPDLPIEAMIKMKMAAVETEVMGPGQRATDGSISSSEWQRVN